MGNAASGAGNAGARDDSKSHAQANDRLCAACYAGNLERVQECLGDGADPACMDYGGEWPLFLACWRGHLAVARWLLASNAVAVGNSATRVTESGWTPFYGACEAGHLKVAQWLYESIPEVRDTVALADYGGQTPFGVACRKGRLEVVQWLCASVPDARRSVTVVDNRYMTPFAAACATGHLHVAKWLYESVPESRSCVAVVDRLGTAPFGIACREGRLEIAQWIYESVPEAQSTITQINHCGKTPLRHACTNGQTVDRDVALWLATLPAFRHELINMRVSAATVHDSMRLDFTHIVANKKASRLVELAQLVRKTYWVATESSATGTYVGMGLSMLASVFSDPDAVTPKVRVQRHRVVGRMGMVALSQVLDMLAPRDTE